jgi:hypothetical protein
MDRGGETRLGQGWKKTGNVNIHEMDAAVAGFFVHSPPGVHGGGWYKFWVISSFPSSHDPPVGRC